MLKCILQRNRQPIRINTLFDSLQLPVILIHSPPAAIMLLWFEQTGTSFNLQFFSSICQVVIRQIRQRQCTCKRIWNHHTSRFRSHCRNHHHSIGCTRTVHGSSSRILQSCNTLDSVRVHIIDFLYRHLKTIQNKSRQVRIVFQLWFWQTVFIQLANSHTGASTDINLRHCIGVRAPFIIFLDTERRVERLDCHQNIGFWHLQQFLSINRYRCSCKTLFIDIGITGHYNFVHLHRLIFHHHLQFLFILERNLFLFHTYKSKHQNNVFTLRYL